MLKLNLLICREEIKMGRTFCYNCNKQMDSVKKNSKVKKYTIRNIPALNVPQIPGKEITDTSQLCNMCYRRFMPVSLPAQPATFDPILETEDEVNKEMDGEIDEETDGEMDEDDYVLDGPTVLTVPISERACFLCQDTSSRKRVPRDAIIQAWAKQSVLIPKNNRTCMRHLNAELEFTDESLDRLFQLSQSKSVHGLAVELLALAELLRDAISPEKHCFSINQMSNSDYKNLTGITKDNFEDMHSYTGCIWDVERSLKFNIF